MIRLPRGAASRIIAAEAPVAEQLSLPSQAPTAQQVPLADAVGRLVPPVVMLPSFRACRRRTAALPLCRSEFSIPRRPQASRAASRRRRSSSSAASSGSSSGGDRRTKAAAPAAFDFDEPMERRSIDEASVKWGRYRRPYLQSPDDPDAPPASLADEVLPMWVADMDFRRCVMPAGLPLTLPIHIRT